MNSTGIGSIHTRFSTRLNRNVYDVKYRVINPKTNKRESKTKRGFRTKGEAQSFLNSITHDVITGMYIVPVRTTIKNLKDQWIKDYAAGHVRENTLKWHKYNLVHIEREMGEFVVSDLTYERILQFIGGLTQYNVKESAAMSATNIAHIIRTLAQMLDFAKEKGIVKENVARHKKIRKALTQLKKESESLEHFVVDQMQIVQMINLTRGTSLALAIALAGLAGLRIGEIRGVELSHIRAGNLLISQQMNKKGEIAPLKTETSKREIPLHALILQLIDEEMERRHDVETIIGKGVFTSQLLFVHTENLKFVGQPYSAAYYGEKLKQLVKRMGLQVDNKKLTMHTFRHSFGSNLIYAGVPIPLVAKWMGHADPTITLAVYTHVIESMTGENIQRFFKSVDQSVEAAAKSEWKSAS